MNTITPATLATELAAAMPALSEQEQHLALSVYHLLASGNPVDRELLADTASLPREQVDETLDRWPGVFSDENQRIIGFHGLTIRPMPHRLTVDGRTLYAWCAWDTMFLPELLGQTAEIHSQCPTTNAPITLTVTGTQIASAHPAETVLSFLHRDEPFDADTITSFCHYVHFFATPAAGDGPRSTKARSRSRSPTEWRSPGSSTERGTPTSSRRDSGRHGRSQRNPASPRAPAHRF